MRLDRRRNRANDVCVDHVTSDADRIIDRRRRRTMRDDADTIGSEQHCAAVGLCLQRCLQGKNFRQQQLRSASSAFAVTAW